MSETRRASLGALALLLVALLACNNDRPLPYVRLGIVVSDASGQPVTSTAGSACVTLPVLRGSQVDKKFPVSDTLRVDVFADRNGVRVELDGAFSQIAPLHVSKDTLERGFFQEIQTYDQSGTSYLVQLSSECNPGAAQ